MGAPEPTPFNFRLKNGCLRRNFNPEKRKGKSI